VSIFLSFLNEKYIYIHSALKVLSYFFFHNNRFMHVCPEKMLVKPATQYGGKKQASGGKAQK